MMNGKTGKTRAEVADRQLAAIMAKQNKMKPRYDFSWRLLAWIFVYALLLTLPFIWVDTPGGIYIGAISDSDLVSRVDFDWQDLDEEKIRSEVMSTHYPLYEQRHRAEWMEEVFKPVTEILNLAADNSSEEALIACAEKHGVKLDAVSAAALRRGVSQERMYSNIINPAQQALYEWVYRQGVMDKERYDTEIAGNRHIIEIIDAGSHSTRGRLAEIGGEGTEAAPGGLGGPVSSDKAGALVKKAIYDYHYLFNISPEMRTGLIDMLTARVAACPTLVYQDVLTKARLAERIEYEQRRRSHVLANSLLIVKGQKITPDDFLRVRAENKAWLATHDWRALGSHLVGKLLLVFFTAVFFTALFYYLVPRDRARRLLGVGVVSLAVFAMLYFCRAQGVAIHLVPIGALAGLVAFGCGAVAGMVASIFFTLMAMLLDFQQMDALAGFLLSGCFFAMLAPMKNSRMQLVRLALEAAGVAAIVVVCWNVSMGMSVAWPPAVRLSALVSPSLPEIRALWAVGGWLLSLGLLLVTMRALRHLFGVTNNIILQDYQEHPLLTTMLQEARSTYIHCFITSSLAAEAARAIGANQVLCRIASLYHDIGKVTKPEYFTENESGESRHDSLSPYMSSIIIFSHVKDGVDDAKNAKLPPEIVDVIAQHHGTTQVGFFLRRAREEEAAGGKRAVDENLFRYPGPKPQSKETAIIMLADSVEAASRSLGAAANYAHIKDMVHKISMGKLNDGQFNESGLNFNELSRIEEALTQMLASMFHSRVSYDNAKRRK